MIDICNNGFLNCSQVIGQIIISTTEYTTGSIFLTFLFIMLFLIVAAMVFRVPIEYTSLIIMPLLKD